MLGVVLYHAGFTPLAGGYAGVDVFFVLSGFLITGGLWDELRDHGRIRFGAFYARRARRLLPAAALVIAVTMLAAARWSAPLAARSVVHDGIASLFYVANYRFALLNTNYLSASAAPSPLLHYWSLAVEEQFYLVWPALLMLGATVWRRRRHRHRRRAEPLAGVAVTIAAVTVASFALSLRLTRTNEPWAFFSLGTRAWELGVGAMLALAAPWLAKVPAALGRVLALVGLAAVMVAFTAFSSATPFPGLAALLPVLGTAAAVAGGSAAGGTAPLGLLVRRPMQAMGRISYSWYLWHFPLLVLAPAVVGHSLGLVPNLGLVVVAAALAAVTTVAVENPIRYAPSLRVDPRRTLSVAAVTTAVVLTAAVLATGSLPPSHGHTRTLAVSLADAAARAGQAPSTTLPTAAAALTGASAVPTQVRTATTVAPDPARQRLHAVLTALKPALASAVREDVVPANLAPSLGRAANDVPAPFVDGCLDGFTDTSVHPCVFGDANGSSTVVLFGDSHAAQWFGSVNGVATARGWRLVVMTKATCPPVDVEVFSPVLERSYTECDRFRQAALARISSLHPALVILAVARHYSDVYHFQVYSPTWLQGMSQMVQQLRASSPRVVVLGPIPKPGTNIPQCLSAHVDDAVQCTQPIQSNVYVPAGADAEQQVVRDAGGAYVNVEPWMCTTTTCAVMVGNILVYRDDNHLTDTFARWLTPLMGARLDLVMQRGAS